MTEQILKKLEERVERLTEAIKEADKKGFKLDFEKTMSELLGIKYAKEIVQEVAKEYDNGWTLCNDRLPEEHKLVLIYAESTARGGSIRRVAQLHNGFWFVQTASDTLGLIGQYNVIKWAELPEV